MKVTLRRQVTNVRLGAILTPGVHDVSEAEARLYRQRGWTDQPPEPEPEAAPPAPPQPVLAEIPDGWRNEHHLVRKRLAREISGQEKLTADEADMIILGEIDRRKGQRDAD
jgi:hypothetical protein